MNSIPFAAVSISRSSGWVLLGCLAALGCGSAVAVNPDPVDFTVKVTSGGKPVSGVNLGLQPTGSGLPSGVSVQDGTGQGKAIAGKYAYFVAPAADATKKDSPAAVEALKAVPEKYHQAHMDHQLTVSNGATIELKLD